jgi:hypothetical protein
LKNVWEKIQLEGPKGRRWKIEKDQESMTEKRNQRELLWFQAGGALKGEAYLASTCYSPTNIIN